MSIWQKIKRFWLDCVEEQERVNLERAKKYPKIFGFPEQAKINFNNINEYSSSQRINPATGLLMNGRVDLSGNPYGYSSNQEINSVNGLLMSSGVDSGSNFYEYSSIQGINPSTGLVANNGIDSGGSPYSAYDYHDNTYDYDNNTYDN